MTNTVKRVLIAEEEHDYNKKYKEGVTVYNITGNVIKAYISIKPVPRFTSVLNENFWREIKSDEDFNTIPSINGVLLDGDKTSKDLGLLSNLSGETSEIPENPVIGTLFYDETVEKYKYYNGYYWIILNDSSTEHTARHTTYRINQNEISEGVYRLPEDMIENHIASKDNNDKTVINSKLVYSDAIRRIRENSHLYVGRYDYENDILLVRQVNDTDKTLFADGTTIVLGDEDDIFMKLPEFWWKVDTNRTGTLIEFVTEEEDADNTYNHWVGNVFIGVYKGIIIQNEGESAKFYSKTGVTPTVNQSWTSFTTAARNRNQQSSTNMYRLVTYEAHQIMALLGYGWLGTTDSQSIIGKGIATYPKTTGLCNSKGMNDSSVSVDGNTTSINFWGLENWWGDISEWIDNLKTSGQSNVNILKQDLTTVKREVITNLSGNDGEIKKMVLGSNADLIPSLIVTNSNYNRAYSDRGYVHSGAGYVANRSNYAANLNGGLGYLSLYGGASVASAYIGSRLLYEGNYSIVNEF